MPPKLKNWCITLIGVMVISAAGWGGYLFGARLWVPPFVRIPYEPFSRESVIALAQREWRLFGMEVRDEQPVPEAQVNPITKPERMEGLWQRVGEYFWVGLGPFNPLAGDTGRHDEQGKLFPPQLDGQYAWSAAFISYIMRIAGAGAHFPYSESHAGYINAAVEQARGQRHDLAITAERLSDYAPQPGDLICAARDVSYNLTFDMLPIKQFASHCDIVSDKSGGMLSVIGGNVADRVALKHVPVTTDGKLVDGNGKVLDTRYHWIVILRVTYDR